MSAPITYLNVTALSQSQKAVSLPAVYWGSARSPVARVQWLPGPDCLPPRAGAATSAAAPSQWRAQQEPGRGAPSACWQGAPRLGGAGAQHEPNINTMDNLVMRYPC